MLEDSAMNVRIIVEMFLLLYSAFVFLQSFLYRCVCSDTIVALEEYNTGVCFCTHILHLHTHMHTRKVMCDTES